jgi:excisionase family DNA binding protein
VTELRDILAPAVVDEIERLIDGRIEAALATAGNGSESPWLSMADAATYVHVSTRTLSRLIKRGRVHSTPLGRRRLVERASLDAYLSEHLR